MIIRVPGFDRLEDGTELESGILEGHDLNAISEAVHASQHKQRRIFDALTTFHVHFMYPVCNCYLKPVVDTYRVRVTSVYANVIERG